jgi:hypothetical protein
LKSSPLPLLQLSFEEPSMVSAPFPPHVCTPAIGSRIGGDPEHKACVSSQESAATSCGDFTDIAETLDSASTSCSHVQEDTFCIGGESDLGIRPVENDSASRCSTTHSTKLC